MKLPSVNTDTDANIHAITCNGAAQYYDPSRLAQLLPVRKTPNWIITHIHTIIPPSVLSVCVLTVFSILQQ